MIRLFRAIAAAGLALLVAGCESRGGGDQPELVFGRTGLGHVEFSYPRAVVAAPQGRLYIVDKAGRVQCLTQRGEFVLEWQIAEIKAGKPTGLGIGPDGRVYAADTHYGRVLVFSARGELIGQFGSLGDGPGQFKLPTDVTVDRQGNLYVSEYGGNDRISKFSSDYKFITSFGGPGSGAATLNRPQTLVVAPDDTLWVSDACNHRICHFTLDGALLGAFGRLGDALGELRFPYGLDLLADGTLVVSEYGNSRLQRFTPDGKSLGVWGRPGGEAGALAYPWAVVVGEGDRVYVIDSGNNRVQVFNGLAAGAWRINP